MTKKEIRQGIDQLLKDKDRAKGIIQSAKWQLEEGTTVLKEIDQTLIMLKALLEDGLYDE